MVYFHNHVPNYSIGPKYKWYPPTTDEGHDPVYEPTELECLIRQTQQNYWTLFKTPPSMPANFPPELLVFVAKYLSTSTPALRNFSRVCRTWGSIARPLIFNSILLRSCHDETQLAELLVDEPCVAKWILSLTYCGIPGYRSWTLWFQTGDELPKLTGLLPNLTSLTITNFHGDVGQGRLRAFVNGFPLIKSLTLLGVGFSAEDFHSLVAGFRHLKTLICQDTEVSNARKASHKFRALHPKLTSLAIAPPMVLGGARPTEIVDIRRLLSILPSLRNIQALSLGWRLTDSTCPSLTQCYTSVLRDHNLRLRSLTIHFNCPPHYLWEKSERLNYAFACVQPLLPFSFGCVSQLRNITFISVPMESVSYVLSSIVSRPNCLESVRIQLDIQTDTQYFWSQISLIRDTENHLDSVDTLLTQGVFAEQKTKVWVSGCQAIRKVHASGRWRSHIVDSCQRMFPKLHSRGALGHWYSDTHQDDIFPLYNFSRGCLNGM